MNIAILIFIILSLSLQNVTRKAFTSKCGDGGPYFQSALCGLAALLYFLVTSGIPGFIPELIPHALGFGASYTAAVIFLALAIANGSLSLTALITSYSLMLPTMYGLIFLKEPAGKWLLVGIVLLAVSLVLINKPGDKEPVTLKWVIYSALAFVGNGMCSVTQKMQQLAFDGAYKNEFMIYSLIFVSAVTLIFTLVRERERIPFYLKKGWYLCTTCGVLNGSTNFLVMVLTGKMATSVMFPSISAGGIVVTYIISKLFYKEKLSKKQLVGFALGTLSVIFLSL